MRILGIREYSEYELRKKLLEKGEDPGVIEQAIAFLLERGFLSDSRYASAIVRRCSLRGYGRARIIQELKRHGIDRSLWDGALTALDELPPPDDTLDKLLQKRLPPSPDRADVKKATDYLLRRGFQWRDISAALRRFGETAADNPIEE